MEQPKSNFQQQIEKTCADLQAYGFEFQFFYMVLKILGMKVGETVSWECEDDVSIRYGKNRIALIQVKHSFTENPGFTNLDDDLWKSFSNWKDLIVAAKEDGNFQFVERASFIIVSNKESRSSILQSIIDFQGQKKTFDNVKEDIEALKSNNAEVQKHIDNFNQLEDSLKKGFLEHLKLELSIDNLINLCKDELRSKVIKENRIEDLFIHLLGAFTKEHFERIKKKEKFSVSFEDFTQKYSAYFQAARMELYIQNREEIPKNVQDQIFIKQLIELGDVKVDESDKQIKLSKYKFHALNNIQALHQNGDITDEEKENYEESAITVWENEFDYINNDEAVESEYNKLGRMVLHNIRQKTLVLKLNQMDPKFSNGTFYYLADEPRIGFRKDWKEKYGK